MLPEQSLERPAEEALMKFNFEKDLLLILLVTADLAFFVLHILYITTDLLTVSLYSLSRDRGYSEFFQYTKELWIAVLLLILGLRQRRLLYFVFSLLFVYFLLDDSLELHEQMGVFLADFLNLQPALGLRAIDFGELLVSTMFGLLFAISIAFSYLLSDPFMRRVALYLLAMIVALAICGIILDMVEIIVTQPVINPILVVLEEGGEMLIMSVITWFAFRLTIDRDQIPLNLALRIKNSA